MNRHMTPHMHGGHWSWKLHTPELTHPYTLYKELNRALNSKWMCIPCSQAQEQAGQRRRGGVARIISTSDDSMVCNHQIIKFVSRLIFHHQSAATGSAMVCQCQCVVVTVAHVRRHFTKRLMCEYCGFHAQTTLEIQRLGSILRPSTY